jgi:putative spermidine/putrescine transport system ATP-binding protein
MMFDTQVLLMDEPLGALDKNLRQQLQLQLRRLHRQLGKTILYVTHDQEEALAMSDRIAVLDRARIIQVGTGRELYERPVTEFVARFFGESNVLTGMVTDTDGHTVNVTIGKLRLSLECPGA